MISIDRPGLGQVGSIDRAGLESIDSNDEEKVDPSKVGPGFRVTASWFWVQDTGFQNAHLFGSMQAPRLDIKILRIRFLVFRKPHGACSWCLGVGAARLRRAFARSHRRHEVAEDKSRCQEVEKSSPEGFGTPKTPAGMRRIGRIGCTSGQCGPNGGPMEAQWGQRKPQRRLETDSGPTPTPRPQPT